ncbi:hypothetical protein AAKU55_005732 [Oxalobacteraceae bacterium GrIS 1.11]
MSGKPSRKARILHWLQIIAVNVAVFGFLIWNLLK